MMHMVVRLDGLVANEEVKMKDVLKCAKCVGMMWLNFHVVIK